MPQARPGPDRRRSPVPCRRGPRSASAHALLAGDALGQVGPPWCASPAGAGRHRIDAAEGGLDRAAVLAHLQHGEAGGTGEHPVAGGGEHRLRDRAWRSGCRAPAPPPPSPRAAGWRLPDWITVSGGGLVAASFYVLIFPFPFAVTDVAGQQLSHMVLGRHGGCLRRHGRRPGGLQLGEGALQPVGVGEEGAPHAGGPHGREGGRRGPDPRRPADGGRDAGRPGFPVRASRASGASSRRGRKRAPCA